MSENSTQIQSGNLFQTLYREPRLSDRVTVEIERMIIAGPLQPGDRLPPERELARQFGVSRTVIREAVRTVAAKGLLEVRAGSGTIISNPKAEDVAHSVSLLLQVGRSSIAYSHVLEVRRYLEVEIAGLAAARRNDDNLNEMHQILQAANEIEQDPDFFVKNDVVFHMALAQATYNPVYVLLLEILTDLMVQLREIGFRVPRVPRLAIQQHQNIFDYVAAGDIEGAQQAMSTHLLRAEKVILENLAEQAKKERK
jgi:GntR family transcriptional repressor for pyruvate dehydrogenase complex